MFASLLGSAANDVCIHSQRQTISADDVLTALRELDIDTKIAGRAFPDGMQSVLEEFLAELRAENEASAATSSSKRKRCVATICTALAFANVTLRRQRAPASAADEAPAPKARPRLVISSKSNAHPAKPAAASASSVVDSAQVNAQHSAGKAVFVVRGGVKQQGSE